MVANKTPAAWGAEVLAEPVLAFPPAVELKPLVEEVPVVRPLVLLLEEEPAVVELVPLVPLAPLEPLPELLVTGAAAAVEEESVENVW